MARFCLSVFLFMALVTSSFAQEVTGEGVGSTKEQAKKEALADLSQNISVEVKSVQTQLSELIGDDFREDASSMIQLESRLPCWVQKALLSKMLITIPHWPGSPHSRQSRYTELNSKKLIGKSSRQLSSCSKPNRTQSGEISSRSSWKNLGILSDIKQCCWCLVILICQN